ncbi:hypothetical protein ACLB1Q_34450 [Escherichia coli]
MDFTSIQYGRVSGKGPKIEREFQAGIQNVVDNYEMHIEAEKNRSPRMSSLIDQLKLTKR